MIVNGTGATQRLVGYGGPDFTATAQERVRLISGTETTERTDDDSVYATYTDSVYNTEADIEIEGESDFPTFTSLDTSIATVNESGQASWVADGSVRILARAANVIKRVWVTVSQTVDGTAEMFDRFVPGSLAHNCADAVDARIAGKTPAAAWPIFSSQDHAGAAYVRSQDCWAADLNLTGVIAWNSGSVTRRAGTAITRDAVVSANHYGLLVGHVIRFVTADNAVVERTVVGLTRVVDTDFRVCLLNSALPASIAHYQVLPADIPNYNPGLADWNSRGRIPALCPNQHREALVTDIGMFHSNGNANFRVPTDAQRLAFYKDKVDGDSGFPAFFIINGALSLVTTWTRGGAGSGPATRSHIDAINTALGTVGSAHTVDVADVSAFPNYGG